MYKIAKEEKFDIVIGSRFVEKTNYNHAFFRKIGTILFQKIIKICCNEDITDPTSGLQILNEKVYKEYSKINNYPEYPDTNLLMEMILKGYKIKEVPVVMKERLYGESMHAGVWGPITYMLKMFYSIFLIVIKYKGKKTMIKIEGENNVN